MAVRKKYEDLTFTDDYIFWRVLTTNPDLCKELIELILDKKIEKIAYSEGQKTLEESPDGHGIRLDVYVENSTEVYNIEMQTTHSGNLPKRMRYYQGTVDLSMLEKNIDYRTLKPTYIIVICTFDFYNKGKVKYTFQNRCDEDVNMLFGDESYKIIVNASAEAVEGKMGELVHYLSGKVTGEFSARLDQAVAEAKRNRAWRRDYMKYELNMMEQREAGKLEERKNTILNIYKQNYGVKEIAKLLKLDEDEVRKVIEEEKK